MTAGVVDASRRFGRRRERRGTLVAISAAALATLGAVGWGLLHSSLLDLRRVVVHLTVNSTSSLSQATVLRAANPPLGRPLAEVDVGRVETAVAALPQVAAVTVRRAWPHDLVVDVVSRRPAVVAEAGGRDLLVDRAGRPYAWAPPGHRRLPVLSVPTLPDQPSAQPTPILAAAVQAWRSVPAKLRSGAARPGYSGVGLSFDASGVHVVWGTAGDAATKAAAVRRELARPSARRPARLDVSAGGVLVTGGTGNAADTRRSP